MGKCLALRGSYLPASGPPPWISGSFLTIFEGSALVLTFPGWLSEPPDLSLHSLSALLCACLPAGFPFEQEGQSLYIVTELSHEGMNE